MEGNSLYGSRLVGYRLETARSVNIDTAEDWQRAAVILSGI
jgi:CMP-N-acetylneuraminic acid synthetase